MKYFGIILIWLALVCGALGQTIRYVDINNPTPVSPFTNGWASAATNIQNAIDVANNTNNIILVSNGVYNTGGRAGIDAYNQKLTNRVVIHKHNITLKSVNGPTVTIIEGRWNNNTYSTINTNVNGGTFGSNSVRCLWVSGTNATIEGFTFSKGSTMWSGQGVTFQSQDRLGPAITAQSNVTWKGITISNCIFHTIAATRSIIDSSNYKIYNSSFSNIFSVNLGSGYATLFSPQDSGFTSIAQKITISNIDKSATNYPQAGQYFISTQSTNDIVRDIDVYNCNFGSANFAIVQNTTISGPVLNFKVYNNTNLGTLAYSMSNSSIYSNHFAFLPVIQAVSKDNIIEKNTIALAGTALSTHSIAISNINTRITQNILSFFFNTAGSNVIVNCTIMNNSFQSLGPVSTNLNFVYNSYFSQNTNRTSGLVFTNYPMVYIDSTSITTNAPLILSDGSYRPAPNSEAINRGSTHPFMSTVDVYGNPRIQGSRVDAGASEYFEAPLSLPYGDWLPFYEALKKTFPKKDNAQVEKININISTLATNSTGLEKGVWYRDGEILKITE